MAEPKLPGQPSGLVTRQPAADKSRRVIHPVTVAVNVALAVEGGDVACLAEPGRLSGAKELSVATCDHLSPRRAPRNVASAAGLSSSRQFCW
jgi:hypothetical protein